ncbi:MAG TPA: hypothetical protein VGN09_15965 [Vicinamibacteria bacterium]|jgi:hypothetical protein
MKRVRLVAMIAVVGLALTVGAGAQSAYAESVSCWAGVDGGPYRSGDLVITNVTWQCTPGIQQQIAPYVTLTAPDGTRYSNSARCYNTTYCIVSVSAPYTYGTWTARAEYAYVVAYDGTSSYFFGGSASTYIP